MCNTRPLQGIMITFYDSHAHLDVSDYPNDLAEVIERAHAAGVEKIVTVGTDLDSSARAIKTAERFPNVYAAVGWHPNEAPIAPDDLRPALRDMARHPKVVAIGETGLDYFRLSKQPSDAVEVQKIKAKQAQVFRQQLEVASETGLNCILHQRGGTLEDTLELLRPFLTKTRFVFHCFSENEAVLNRILALGAFISFTGIVSFKNSENVRNSLIATPSDRFMLETDCPYLAPIPYRGKRCEPSYLVETAKIVAELRNCTLEELGAATNATARGFFPKMK